MASSSEPSEESNTRSVLRRVWMNILDPIKYSGNQVRRFSDSEMGTGLSIPILDPNTQLNI